MKREGKHLDCSVREAENDEMSEVAVFHDDWTPRERPFRYLCGIDKAQSSIRGTIIVLWKLSSIPS